MNNHWKQRSHKERKRKKLSRSDETGKIYLISGRQTCSAEAANKLGENEVTWRRTGS